MQPESGAGSCSCHVRADSPAQATALRCLPQDQPAGRSVKSWVLPDFPRRPRQKAPRRPFQRSRRGGWSRPRSLITRLSNPACRSGPDGQRRFDRWPLHLPARNPGYPQRRGRGPARAPTARRRRPAARGSFSCRARPRRSKRGSTYEGIVEPLHAACEERGGEARPRDGEQGSQQPHLRLLDQGRHAGEAVGAAPAGRAHGHGLGLIVGVVRQQQMQDAPAPAFPAQQPIARRAGRLLKAGAGLGAGPARGSRLRCRGAPRHPE